MSRMPEKFLACLLVGIVLAACVQQAPARPTAEMPVSAPTLVPTMALRTDGLSEQDAGTLGSLEKVDDYPLYTMRYRGSYDGRMSSRTESSPGILTPAWACSLLAALGDPNHRLYGRNFDWNFSPALLLFTEPPDAYVSVSMVDITYLGLGADKDDSLTDLALSERRALLQAPLLPFDGMNERGLVVGMAAVPPGDMKPDPAKETIGSVGVIREMLDHAATVDEAVAIIGRYNVDMAGGPPIHYLIADRSGRAALVEFYQGKMRVSPNDQPWHQATNFLASAVSKPEGQCWRYDKISQRLAQAQGRLTAPEAFKLLGDVAQDSTQWSIVYDMSTGDIQVSMGRQYQRIHTFHLGRSH